MNRLIFIGLIFYLNSLVNCRIQLEYLCPKSVFIHENTNGLQYEVNAILRTQLNISFADLDVITFNYPEEHYLKYFKNKDHAIRMAKLAKLYDDKIKEIYTENYINNIESFNNIEKDLKLIKNYYKQITHLRINYMQDSSFSFWTNNRIYSGLYLVKSLDFYRRNKLESTDLRFAQFSRKMNDIIMDVDMGNENNLIYVLGQESMIDTFNYELIQMNKFEFCTNESPDPIGVVKLDLLVPFFDKNYKTEKNENCVESSSLPKFYQR